MFTAIYAAYSTWGKGEGDPLVFIVAFFTDMSIIDRIFFLMMK